MELKIILLIGLFVGIHANGRIVFQADKIAKLENVKNSDSRSFGSANNFENELQFGIPFDNGLQPVHSIPHIQDGIGVHNTIPTITDIINGNNHNLPITTGCRYWCRTPVGQYYCCENINQQPSFVFNKPGLCPPVRPVCPPVRSNIGPPQPCSNDGSCQGFDKCCFDVCLKHHTCKAPQGVGR